MCLKIHELDPLRFLAAPMLARQGALKKAKVKLNFLTDIDMLLMVEKGIRGGMSHAIHRYVKANEKYQACNKRSKIIWYQNQTIIEQFFFQKIY